MSQLPDKPKAEMEDQENLLGKREARLTFTREFSELYSGPLPPPELLKGYSELPGFIEAILSNWQEEGSHRRGLEIKQVEYDQEDRKEERKERQQDRPSADNAESAEIMASSD